MCPFLPQVKEITTQDMMDKVTDEPIGIKVIYESSTYFNKNHNDWQETCYQLLARSFGFKINADPLSAVSPTASVQSIA